MRNKYKYNSIASSAWSKVLITNQEVRKIANSVTVARKNNLFESVKKSLKKIDFAKFADTIWQTQFLPTKINKAAPDAVSGELALKLIDSIANEYNISSNIKTELKRLEVYFQLLIAHDSSFLYDINHPGRHLIDLICRESLFFRSEMDIGHQDFHTIIKLLCTYMVNSKLHPLVTLDKATTWVEPKLTILRLNLLNDLRSKECVSPKSTRRHAMACRIALNIAKHHPLIKVQPLYIKDFIRNEYSNVIADYALSHSYAENIKFKTRVLNIVLNLLTTVTPLKKRTDTNKYKKDCKNICNELKRFFKENLFGQSCNNFHFFIANLTRHQKYILTSSLHPSRQSIFCPAFLSDSKVSEYSKAMLTNREREMLGISNSNDDQLADSCLNDVNNTHKSTYIPTGTQLKDIEIISKKSHFYIFYNNKWNNLTLQSINYGSDGKPGMFMFRTLSCSAVTMTRRQLSKLIESSRVFSITNSDVSTMTLKPSVDKQLLLPNSAVKPRQFTPGI